MARGIQVPLTVNNGRLKKLAGDDYIDQLIRVALIGMESDNPFQSMGLGAWMIFAINDAMTESEIRERVVLIFKTFQADQLAKLDGADSAITFRRDGGDLWMDVAYINMETQERQLLEVAVPPAGD